MFFEACARLAEERPELRDTVTVVDRLLHENQGQEITLDFLVAFVSASRLQLQFIFESLQESPDFTIRTVNYCAVHDQPVHNSGVCDICDDDETARTIEKATIKVPLAPPNNSNVMANQSPRVLISYSHDSREHTDRILRLSDQLRKHGVDCHIDQYTPVPKEGWPVWMNRQIQQADYVLCVCSNEYLKRFTDEVDTNVGRGVSWEANLILNALYESKVTNSGKFLTVQFDQSVPSLIPNPLKGFTSFRLSDFSLKSEDYDKLYRHLTGQPATPIIELGPIVRLKEHSRKSEGAPERIDASAVSGRRSIIDGELADGNKPQETTHETSVTRHLPVFVSAAALFIVLASVPFIFKGDGEIENGNGDQPPPNGVQEGDDQVEPPEERAPEPPPSPEDDPTGPVPRNYTGPFASMPDSREDWWMNASIHNNTNRRIRIYRYNHKYPVAADSRSQAWSNEVPIEAGEETVKRFTGGFHYVVIRDLSDANPKTRDIHLGWKDFGWRRNLYINIDAKLFQGADPQTAVQFK